MHTSSIASHVSHRPALPCPALPCPAPPRPALPCPPCPALSCPDLSLPCPVLPHPALPYTLLPRPAMSLPCPALSCLALPCHCPALPCRALPCPPRPALPCLNLPCPALHCCDWRWQASLQIELIMQTIIKHTCFAPRAGFRPALSESLTCSSAAANLTLAILTADWVSVCHAMGQQPHLLHEAEIAAGKTNPGTSAAAALRKLSKICR